MVEEPNFEYHYDLAYRKSFAARLSFRIMGVAAAVFLVAVILFFHFTGDSMTLPLTHQIVKYGSIVFVVGLASLFIFCTWAIYQMVRPLRQFTESVMSIANGNLDTPLPTIHSEDELLQLRNSFEYMQRSLKQHINDLQATTASKERLQSELKIAHDIQMGMIPTTFPQRQDLELYASMTPAKEVGGDLYDFIIEDDELFFIIGDVAGKGVPASLYMAVTRTLFRNLAGNYQSAANIVREMNHAIASTNDSYIFVTVFVGVLDLKTHHLTYCNAAHNAPVMITAEGECSLLEVENNLPVGVEDRYKYGEQQVDFPPGSALLLYTDGLPEAIYLSKDGSRKLFGDHRVLHDVEKNCRASGIEIIDYLKQHVSLRTFFFSVCREHGIDEETAKNLNLALEEWVANVINYAYPKGMRGHVEVTADVSEHKLLTLVVKDHGEAFDPTQYSEVDVDAELDDRQIGGLGIYLVRSIMDTLSYERTADGYNRLTLKKQL